MYGCGFNLYRLRLEYRACFDWIQELKVSTAKYKTEEIASELCVFLRENILAPNVEVTASTELSNIGVDSFSLMELVLFIERRFSLILAAESLTPDNIASVGNLSAYCISQLSSADT